MIGKPGLIMTLIHYSREGYNGDYTYTSVCGKKVKTTDSEGSTVHADETNCDACMKSKKYKTDFTDLLNTSSTIKRRIYIESDILKADEFRSAQRDVFDFANSFGLKCVDRVFSDVLDYAWHDLEKTWQAVKSADEIYATSSLMPLSGGSYMGAPVIFNGMCERAVKENVTGKSIIIFNTLKNINWDMIDIKLMKTAFQKNNLFLYDDEYELTKIDTSKIKK